MHWWTTFSSRIFETQLCTIPQIVLVHLLQEVDFCGYFYYFFCEYRYMHAYLLLYVAKFDANVCSTCGCVCFPAVTWAEDGWTLALWQFSSFHFPACLTFPMPHIRYALHLRSRMTRLMCSLSLVYPLSVLPWASQPVLTIPILASSTEDSSCILCFIIIYLKYAWYWLCLWFLFFFFSYWCCSALAAVYSVFLFTSNTSNVLCCLQSLTAKFSWCWCTWDLIKPKLKVRKLMVVGVVS